MRDGSSSGDRATSPAAPLTTTGGSYAPIHFTDRKLGTSKLTLKQQLLYLQHLRRLYMYKFATGLVGLVFNFLANRFVVFRRQHVVQEIAAA